MYSQHLLVCQQNRDTGTRDVQVKLLVERAYRRAKDLVQSNIQVLHDVAAVLMEKENIDGDEFQRIIMASSARQYLKDDAPGVTIPYQA
jgi:cell division protease FtsH